MKDKKDEDISSEGFIINEINEAHQIKMNCSNDLPYKDNTLIESERLNLKKAVDYLIFFCYILMAFAFFNFLFNSQ